MSLRIVYLVDTDERLSALRGGGVAEAYLIDAVAELDLSQCEIVVIARGAEAKERALGFAERGLDRTRLSYVDLQVGDTISARLSKPKHLFWDDVIPLSEVEGRDFLTYKSGIGFLDKNLQWGWRIPELVVMAGAYGSGKSTIGQILAANFVSMNGVRLDNGGAMLCSWEDLDIEVKRNISNFKDHIGENWTPALDAARWNSALLDNIHFVRRAVSEDRLISWYADLVKYHRMRYGTRFFLLDPWNEMDHQKDARKSETEYIRDIMKDLRRLVDEEKIILVLATHVSAKYIRGTGELEPFKIGHAFGSSQFGNKADRGICIARTKKYEPTRGHTIIRLDKSKIERRMGFKGTIAARFDDSRFCLEYDDETTKAVKEVWKD